MQSISQALRELPADPDRSDDVAPIAALSDADLVRAVAEAIARPKADGGNSYTLHAPMELLARGALLPLLPPESRGIARMRIATIAALYAAQGDEIEPPRPAGATVRESEAALITALRDDDPDGADLAVTALAPAISAHDLCDLLADEIAPRLGAAAHAPILLAGLRDAAARYGNMSLLLRASIRALATAGRTDTAPRLTWIDQPIDLSGPESLWEVLADPPRRSSSIFIAPTMLAVEAHGLAAHRLGRATQDAGDAAARSLMRIAALSMLQDDAAHAPYGWSHCLTIPQGIIALVAHSGDGIRLIRLAATAVLGFRSTLGRVSLAETMAIGAVPDIARLAGRAAAHADAHLAKYTVACLTAAAADPMARPLFLAAADRLGRWWDAHDRGEAE